MEDFLFDPHDKFTLGRGAPRISLLGPSGASRESERVQVPQRPRKPLPTVYTRPLRKDFELNLPYHQQ